MKDDLTAGGGSPASRQLRHDTCPWPITVRESRRAKHVTLKISVLGELEAVIPLGYDRSRLGEIITARQASIEKALRRFEQVGQSLEPGFYALKPTEMSLLALAETWQIVYLPTSSPGIVVKPMGDRALALMGRDCQRPSSYQVLRQWLKRKAELDLIPQLDHWSRSLNLPYVKVGIRGQRTRWGSCSDKKHISLNYKLLFLPPSLVDYVLVHELCHTVHMNHSAAFWQLVGENLVNYAIARQQLKQGWQYVPRWVEAQ